MGEPAGVRGSVKQKQNNQSHFDLCFQLLTLKVSELFYLDDNYDVIYKINRAEYDVVSNIKGRSNRPVTLLGLVMNKL